jgi:UDP-N-acetylmuramoyl-L-alanyl-D-glutamate--2,6-diaminopimelate ligase
MASTGRSLGDLASLVEGTVVGDSDSVVIDVTHDSREARPGTLFVAVRGSTVDGHQFIPEVIRAGTTAVAVEETQALSVDQLVVADTRKAMGRLAAAVHDDPSAALDVVGVTGTNGKTTVTHYLQALLTSAGKVAGLIGTIETRVGATRIPSARTTPEATDFQRILATMRDLGADTVAAEISSHALEMGRVAGTRFAVAAFTNLSQDHLDFHHDMDGYRRAKERLFHEYEVGTAVVNIDDETGAGIAGSIDLPTLTVGDRGDIRAGAIETSFDGTRFELTTPDTTVHVTTPIIGSFNVENAAMAIACCLALGIDLDPLVEGLASIPPVSGRFEEVRSASGSKVFVDYAHTPDGIIKTIALARSLATGRVIAVVGAGGDRDRDKRPLMGAAATQADFAILTSDNPRSEDPGDILSQVAAGAAGNEFVTEVDRHRAIALAIEAAMPGDIVLILGKGHETVQEIGDSAIPFDDRRVARSILETQTRSTDSGPISGSMSA